MCVCVCMSTLNLGSVFTLSLVYHCSVCAAVNIRQQLDLRGWRTSASPADCPPEWTTPARTRRQRQRCDLKRWLLNLLSMAAWQAACLRGIDGGFPPTHHLFFWMIMGTIAEQLQRRQTLMQQQSISVTNGTRILFLGLHFLERLSGSGLLKSPFFF